jgi:hypothetical protein
MGPPGEFETDQNLPVPIARPLPPEVIISAAPLPPYAQTLEHAPVDRCAIASAVCGFTPFVPIVSQVAGLVLGYIALKRIRRRQRDGLRVRGRGCAWFGISSSVLTLLGWMGMAAALFAVRQKLDTSAGALRQIQALNERSHYTTR